MEFTEFKKKFQNHITKMFKNQKHLFVTGTDKEVLWNKYLDSFPTGTNEIFRERREFDCSCCRHFIYSFGNVVAIENNKMISIWDFETGDSTYQPVIDAMSEYVKSLPVANIFISKESSFGTDKNLECLKDGDIKTWNHFHCKLPDRFVYRSSDTVATEMSKVRDMKNVFKRSLEEITKDSLEITLDLIAQKSLHKGPEWKTKLEKFLQLQNEYRKLNDNERDLYCWTKSIEVGGSIAKIRNHAIGIMLVEISKGSDLDSAVRKYGHAVDPNNYHHPNTIFSQKQVDEFKQELFKRGYEDSLGRRFAVIEDITRNNVLFANTSYLKKTGGDVFSQLKSQASPKPKKFSKVEEVSIEKFISDILPNLTNIELFFENKHSSNLVSVISPKIADSKIITKWDNNNTWAYGNNLTDSTVKENVKAAGGRVEGPLRYSIQWNDGEIHNPNDFDAHCVEPNSNHIYFPTKKEIHPSSAMLDTDVINPERGKPAVENIIWTDKRRMMSGRYKLYVNCYSNNGGTDGFKAELEYEGQIYHYEYNQRLRQNQSVLVAEFDLDVENNKLTFIKSLPSTTSSKTIWNLQTNEFHPVSVFMYSPNYWDEQSGIGHKHYFFILKNCIREDQPSGFFNEFIKEDLLKINKRIFEALSQQTRVEPSENQLSGLGFSITKSNSIVAKVEGSMTRMLKIIF